MLCSYLFFTYPASQPTLKIGKLKIFANWSAFSLSLSNGSPIGTFSFLWREKHLKTALSTCSWSQPRIFFASEELCSKPSNSLSLFFIHMDIVLFGTPNFLDFSLLVILFSIFLMIWHFCINFVFFSSRWTADILAQAFLVQSKTFTFCNILVAIEFCNFERFDYIRIFKYRLFLFYLLCKWTFRQEKVRDRERNSRKGPRFLFEIEKNLRYRASR